MDIPVGVENDGFIHGNPHWFFGDDFKGGHEPRELCRKYILFPGIWNISTQNLKQTRDNAPCSPENFIFKGIQRSKIGPTWDPWKWLPPLTDGAICLNDHKNPKLKEMLVETRVFPHHVDFAKGGPLFSLNFSSTFCRSGNWRILSKSGRISDWSGCRRAWSWSAGAALPVSFSQKGFEAEFLIHQMEVLVEDKNEYTPEI